MWLLLYFVYSSRCHPDGLIVAFSGHTHLIKTHGELETGERLLHGVLLKSSEFDVKRFCIRMYHLFVILFSSSFNWFFLPLLITIRTHHSINIILEIRVQMCFQA